MEARAGYDPANHSGKALANVLEHYPRDELFQVDEDTLYNFGLAILQLDERPRVRVLARRDRFDRFVSVLVYVPRERYDSHIRAKIGAYLARVFIGRVSAFYPFFREEGSLVRVHFIIGRSGGATPVVEPPPEQEVQSIIRTWSDGLNDALAWLIRRTKCASCLVVTGTLSRRAFTKPTTGGCRRRHSCSRKSVGRASAWRRFSPQAGGRSAQRRAESVELARPLPLSNEFRSWKTWGSGSSTSAPITSSWPPRRLVRDMLLTRFDGGMIDLDAGGAQLETAFLMVMRGAAENEAITRSRCKAELPGAT